MPELRDVLAAEAARGRPAVAPPFETVIARARHRQLVQISSIVAVVLAVGVVVAIPMSVRSHRATGVTADGTGATTEAGRKAVTQQAAKQFADGVQLPAGATLQSTAPSQLLAAQQNSPGSQNLVDAVRFFTVPGTIDGVLAFVSAHPPHGMFENGSESSATDGATVTQGVIFSALETHDYGAPVVRVTATNVGTGIGVRVDADLVWRPLRTAAEQIPVDATATLGGVALDHDATREVATFFNSLDAEAPLGDRYCGAQTGGSRVTFATGHGSLAFDSSSCAGVVVTANGVRQPTLELPDVIPAGLQSLLGLSIDLSSAPASSSGSSSALAPASEAPKSTPPR
jgi:hypothetical protein